MCTALYPCEISLVCAKHLQICLVVFFYLGSSKEERLNFAEVKSAHLVLQL